MSGAIFTRESPTLCGDRESPSLDATKIDMQINFHDVINTVGQLEKNMSGFPSDAIAL